MRQQGIIAILGRIMFLNVFGGAHETGFACQLGQLGA